MKDQYNDLYDPLMANNVCVAGQLLLLDLIEKVAPYGDLIQSNTDGILVKLYDGQRENYIKACDEWCERTRLDLEHDPYVKVIQKDVNNYIIVEPNGKYKSKGAYVKKLSKIDYDLPIVNEALIEYFTNEIPVEDTVNNCNDLIKFQKIVKVSRKYRSALHGEEELLERVIRVFASTDENDGGIFKIKEEGSPEKIGNTPEHAFIYNDDVTNITCPDKLDKNYYIEMAKSRVNDFINGKTHAREKSDIKGVVLKVKQEVIERVENTDGNIEDFLIDCYTNSEMVKKTHLEKLAKLGYLDKYGNTKAMELAVSVFNELWDKKNDKFKEKITTARVSKLKYDMNLFNTYSVKEGKYFKNLSARNIIQSMISNIEDYTHIEKININMKNKDIFDYSTGLDEHRMVLIVTDVHDGDRPNVVMRSLGSGKLAKVLVAKSIFKNFEVNKILKVDRMFKIPKKYYDGKRMVDHQTEKQWIVEKISDYEGWKIEE